jgi:pyruvate dehydrogenase E2 component (dihydrolipoamide acetyltransferase)
MTIEILMPALSPTMTEGNLSAWLKSEGEEVTAGDVIAEIETDKATMEVEAVDEGTLGKILVPAGSEGVAVNTPIAILLEEGEDQSALAAAAEKAGRGEAEEAAKPATETKAPPAAEPETPPQAMQPPPAAAKPPSAPSAEPGERIFASPLARRMAEQAGLDLVAIRGSGPHGRIVKADIESALSRGVPAKEAPAPAAAPTAAPIEIPGMPDFDLEPLNNIRKTIARRLVEAKQTIPHFYLTIDCELDRLLAVRKDLNARSPEGVGAYKLSVNDFVIRASALALRKVPKANASFGEDGLRFYKWVDISVAVAIEDGLITPIIRHAESKGLAEISNEMKALAAKARDGKLMPEEYQGGTFSVSNLGMYGVKHFEAVINPPQGCILAVGAGEQRPIVKDGALAVATVMSCTLSVDHRVVDGALGAQFLAEFKRLIEDPMQMLL